jgi:hypothetical protein
MPVRFLITTLKPGADPAEYEKWVREYDYKIARGRENMISYEVCRIEGPVEGVPGAHWSYIERIEVKSIEQADRDAKSESGVELRRQLFGKFVEQSKNVTFVSEIIK